MEDLAAPKPEITASIEERNAAAQMLRDLAAKV